MIYPKLIAGLLFRLPLTAAILALRLLSRACEELADFAELIAEDINDIASLSKRMNRRDRKQTEDTKKFKALVGPTLEGLTGRGRHRA